MHPKTNVGSMHDCDKTLIPYTEHEHCLICRIIREQVNDDNQDSDNDNHEEHDVSEMSNDESTSQNQKMAVVN